VDRCVPLWNETDRPLPEDFPPEASNALVGCLACQRCCPANGAYFASAEHLSALSEQETRLLLSDWQPALKDLLARVLSWDNEETLREWAPVLRRNLASYLQSESRAQHDHFH
jgi:epoxyqueuosine reductase QueG